MISASGLQRLLAWLSPAFPIGGFAWSAGLETAIADGHVFDAATTSEWIASSLHAGSLRVDAVLLAEAHRQSHDRAALADTADWCLALTAARERREETLAMGNAFIRAASAWDTTAVHHLPEECPYPVAIGAIAASQAVPLDAALVAHATSTVQSQISVAVRLVPIGQSDGLTILAGLEPEILRLSTWATNATLADIGTMSYAADIAQMRHETQTTRIFRS
ncbi:urease accessory protein UreF [Devosia pacifica]|uniref:Urease accessory protein UreF n=1 Tax=Devosia pacifica TaxID=1335967 RepID=A0A918RYL2_9HYPH|nr:urease accessory protein UreF [Devosia pacifica]GHA16103.1 urease accessory protein UreF [Devosia pacifica]